MLTQILLLKLVYSDFKWSSPDSRAIRTEEKLPIKCNILITWLSSFAPEHHEMINNETRKKWGFQKMALRGGMVMTRQSARSHWSAHWEEHQRGMSQFAPLKHTKSQDLEVPRRAYSKISRVSWKSVSEVAEHPQTFSSNPHCTHDKLLTTYPSSFSKWPQANS